MKANALLASLLVAFSVNASASDNFATLRGGAIDNSKAPPRISKVEDDEGVRKRAYPMQPPTIPHTIDNYQVDLNVNKCMSCHSRRRTADSQAPMVSVTHYMDREANFLAEISPRRYFCEQCHVVQTRAKPQVGNTFVDIDELIAHPAAGRQ
jgi:cytochrome c-type protein NapB